MEALRADMVFYSVPAFILCGAVLLVARRRVRVFRFEYASWLLPGVTYWFLSEICGLTFAGKSLANMVEPIVLAGLVAVLLAGRCWLGACRPDLNRTAALTALVSINIAALVVLAAVPALPE